MRKADNLDVTVIIPTVNEEKNIGKVIRGLNHLGYNNIVIIDGNSRDRTVEIAKEFGVAIVLQNGRGKGAALRQAFEHDNLNGDVVVIIDADGSMDPKEVPMLVDALNSGADLVKGSRFLQYGYSEDMDLVRRIGNRFFLALVNSFWSTNYTDLCYGLGAFRRKALKTLTQHLSAKHFEIEAEICILAKRLGLRVREVPSVELRRSHGNSNLNTIVDGFRILIMILRRLLDRLQPTD